MILEENQVVASPWLAPLPSAYQEVYLVADLVFYDVFYSSSPSIQKLEPVVAPLKHFVPLLNYK